MTDKAYIAQDPAAPNGDLGATVKFTKRPDGVIDVLEMLHDSPIPDWQKRTIELIEKYKGKRPLVYMPPRRMGKSFFALMMEKHRRDLQQLEEKLLQAVCDKLISSWGRIVPGEEIYHHYYGQGGGVVYKMPDYQGVDHAIQNANKILAAAPAGEAD